MRPNEFRQGTGAMTTLRILDAAFTGAVIATAATPTLAAQCNTKGGFPAFLTDIKKEATKSGIWQRGLATLDGLTIDDKVLAADRRQHVFKQSFEEFSGRMISKDRMIKGERLMKE